MQGSKKVNNYRVPKGTTHLMMWIGSCLPREREVHYQNKDGSKLAYEDEKKRNGERAVVDYVATLRGECEKMNKKGDSCILVYDSRMIRQKDKKEMEKIVEKIPNCYLVDYKDYVEELKKEKDLEFKGSTEVDDGRVISLKCKQSEFIKDIDDNITFNSETNGINSETNGILRLKKYSIGNLVDCMRILLLLHPSKLKQLATKKNKDKKPQLDCKDCTLLYHDFDMIQQDVKPKLDTQAQKDNDDQIREKEALFVKNMGNGCSSGNENGLIWVNSVDDRNSVLENMISNYLYGFVSNKDNQIIYSHAENAERNNFIGQFSDESHQSWGYASETDIKKRINISENDYSRITEKRLKGLLWTCYKDQLTTIPVQLNGNEIEMPITEFLEKVNKEQNDRYKEYTKIAGNIYNGALSKNNKARYFDNIKLEENEETKICYPDAFLFQKEAEQLEKQISEKINKHLGKSKDNPKKLHFDKDPNKGCKNEKLLNVRRFGFHRDYINKINDYYEKKLASFEKKNYNDLYFQQKYNLLEELNNYVTGLENEKANNGFFPCVSANEYRKVKIGQATGLPAGNYPKQGMY